MAAHEVKPVQDGERYSYLGWYSHGTPNPEVGESVVDPGKELEMAKNATNLYMPNLVPDYRNYLLSKGYDESSEQFNLTRSNY
jgi:hypothetical protein